jgi:hypothetical protein
MKTIFFNYDSFAVERFSALFVMYYYAYRKNNQRFEYEKIALKISGTAGIIIISTTCNYLPSSWIDAFSDTKNAISQNGNSLFHQTDAKKLNISGIGIQGEVKNASAQQEG